MIEQSTTSASAVLRPGLRVLRRERDQLQVGLDPDRSARLPDTPAVRRTLGALAGTDPGAPRDPGVVARLVEQGLAGPPRRSGRRLRVALRTAGGLPPAVRAALRDVGLPDAVQPAEDLLPDVGLLVSVGEPRRELLDDWIASGQPHLVVRFTEGAAVVGPYVVPGATACLRCLDAHRTDTDVRWPLLLAQETSAISPALGPAFGAERVDPVLARLAAAWAARDLATAMAADSESADSPATWSTTVRLPVDLGGFEAVGWLRHPACGCSIGL